MKRVRLTGGGVGGNYFTDPNSTIKFIPTGCTILDKAIGASSGGGWPEDRIINIVGDKSTGKTLLCIEAATNFLKIYPKARVRYRETEAAFIPEYAAALGLPIEQVDFGADQLDTVEDLFADLTSVIEKAKGPELYILDSLDALSDEAELERDMNKGSYGTQKAKNLSQMFRRLTRLMANKHVTLIIVSQVRSKIGLSFGRNTTRSGGRALDFYASVVVYLTHLGSMSKTVSGQKRATGVTVRAKIDKNKISLPSREAEFNILFGYGIDDISACTKFLEEVKATKELKAIGVPGSKEAHAWATGLVDEDYADVVKELREAVSTKWSEIDTKLMPARSKYR